MRIIRGLGAMSAAYLRMTVRSKTALFWTLLFPLVFLLGFGYIFGGGDPQRVSYLVPGLLTITVISATFFGTSINMVSQREAGIFRRYRVTPVTPLVVVLAHALTSLVTLSASIALQIVVGMLIFDIRIAGSVLSFVIAALAGFFAFIPLGLIVGSVAKDTKTAPAITNLLFFPMMFLSGAALPFFFLPGWLQSIGKFLPATYLVEALLGVMVRGENIIELAVPVGILLFSGLIGFALNSLLFRWESTEPVNKKNLGFALGTLAAVYFAAALVMPQFKMARSPAKQTAGADAGEAQKVLVLRGLTVFDGLGGRIENARVVLDSGKITAVKPDDNAPIPAHATVIDCAGKYLIPGLFDSHVHLGGSGGGQASLAEFSPRRQIRDLQAFLAVGVTSVLSLTDDLNDLISLRAAVENGEMRAPRIFFAGPAITAPGGHPAAMFSFVPGLAERLTRQVRTPEEARAAVQELAAKKVDLIKLVLEEGFRSRGALPRLSEAAFREAIRAARAAGLQTTVHVDSDKNARLAIDAGANGIEHVPGDLSEKTAQMMVASGITLTPTLAVYDGYRRAAAGDSIDDPLVARWADPGVVASLNAPGSWLVQLRHNKYFVAGMAARYRKGVQAARLAVQKSVRIIAGSDSGNPGTFHGPGLIHELELLATAGMPLEEVLIAATSRPATRLGRNDLGRIVRGATADLVILNADPTRDIRAYRQVDAVYFNGRRLDREKLLTTSPGKWTPGS